VSIAPVFLPLDRAASEALLHAHHVGRLAYSFRNRVDIEPIHFVFRDGWLYGRTQHGTKVNILAHEPWVAFEVDEVDGLFDWRSVVVHGRIEFPDPEGSPLERAQHERAVAAFRTLLPDAFTALDPTPSRDLVFAISVQEITGRAAQSVPVVSAKRV